MLRNRLRQIVRPAGRFKNSWRIGGLVYFVLGVSLLLVTTTPAGKYLLDLNDHQGVSEKYHMKPVCPTPPSGKPQCHLSMRVNEKGQPVPANEPTQFTIYGPELYHIAYNLPCTPGGSVRSTCTTPDSYGPKTIVLVEYGSYGGDGTIESNLATFDQYFNLPPCTKANGCLSIVNGQGQPSPLPSSQGGSWADEMNLDVQVAHSVCQSCKIVVMQASQLYQAVDYAATHMNPTAISNSWSYRSGDKSALDTYADHKGVAIVGATGDSRSLESEGNWPADDPHVVAASGTRLFVNDDETWKNETVDTYAGGGCALYHDAPIWQTSLLNWDEAGCGTHRAVGDVAMDSSTAYDSSRGTTVQMPFYDGPTWGWQAAGGTSTSAPLVASIYALAGGVPDGVYAPAMLYANYTDANMHDITEGNNCSNTVTEHCTAGLGFDTPTGLGSFNGISILQVPMPPTNITADAKGPGKVSLSWSASKSNYSVDKYAVYRNGNKINSLSGTSFTDTTAKPNIAYIYKISATDQYGTSNKSSVTITTYYNEDINQDKHINLLDLSLLGSKYGNSGLSIGRSDVNSDGSVNLLDLSLLGSKYGSE